MVLACDVNKPHETQPRIFAKQPTLNQQRKLISVISDLQKNSIGEQLDAILDAASMMLTGWENIPLEFTRENIGEVLNLEELVEVLSFLVSASATTPADKKKSESPPSSELGSSANLVVDVAGM